MPDDPLSEALASLKRPASSSHLADLTDFAKQQGLTVGSTTGGTHNRGSKHYSGNAIDIRGSGGFSDDRVRSLSDEASSRGLLLRDERKRPPGQAVWGGPHVHLEYAGESDSDPLSDALASLKKPEVKPQPQKTLSSSPFFESAAKSHRYTPRPKQLSYGEMRQNEYPRDLSLVELKQAEDNANRGQPTGNPLNADLRVMKGEQPVDRLAYQRQRDLESREPERPPIREPEPASMQAPDHSPLTRVAETMGLSLSQKDRLHLQELIGKYAPGLASLDTPEGPTTDFPRGVVSGATLGAVGGDPPTRDEEILPGLTRKGLGEAVGGLAPLIATGSMLPGGLSPAVRTAATFGATGAGRQAVNAAEGRPVDVTAPLEEAALGLVMGRLEGANPGMMRRITAYVTPGIALDVAKGASAEDAAKRAWVNLGFAVTGGGKHEEAERGTPTVNEETQRRLAAGEQNAQRFQHLQFGKVEVTPDQTGAKAGRIKVAEVENPDAQHFVKKSDMQGRGNSRMIPIIEPKVEVPSAIPEATEAPAVHSIAELETKARETEAAREAMDKNDPRYMGEARDAMYGARKELFDAQQREALAAESGAALVTEAASPASEITQPQLAENDILHLDIGHRSIDVFQNPTGADYRELKRRFREEYPNAPKGEPDTRFTKDAQGNIYVWASGDAIHSDVDPALRQMLGRETAQNMPARAAWEARRSKIDASGQTGAAFPTEPTALPAPIRPRPQGVKDASTKTVSAKEAATENGTPDTQESISAGLGSAGEPPGAERVFLHVPDGAGDRSGNNVTPRPRGVEERSFPKTAVAAGHEGGTDLTYDVLSNQESLRTAEKRIATQGVDRAIADLAQKVELGGEDTATGILLMQKLEQAGDVQRASDVASDLSRKLTKAGQGIQAASIISKLSPEGVLMTAQKSLKPGAKLTVNQGTELIGQAKKVQQAELRVAKATAEMRDTGDLPITAKTTKTRIENLQSRLQKMEATARQSMKDRQLKAQAELKGDKGERGAALNPAAIVLDLKDMAIIGASKLAQKGINFATWKADMVKEFGEDVKPHLSKVYRDSYQIWDDNRRQVLQAQKERGAAKAGRTDVNAFRNEQLDAQTEARHARLELKRMFDDLSSTPLKRVGRVAQDVAGLTRALQTTGDLSFGLRQGKIALARHPITWAKGFGRQFQGMSPKRYERFVSEMELDSDFKYARRGGLELTSPESAGLAGKEEAFQSGFVHKIPVLKQSEMSYNTMADYVRFNWFKSRLNAMRKMGVDLEAPESKAILQNEATLINDATGRTKLPFGLNKATPLINTFAYSARFWASRVKMLGMPLNPKMYTDLASSGPARAQRVEAWKTLFAFYGLVGGQLALAKLSGATIGTNPDDPDFLKARWGKLHIDFSAGLQSHIRVVARLAKAIHERETVGKSKSSPADILSRYARGKESPNLSLIHDLFFSDKTKVDGETYGTTMVPHQPAFPTGKPGASAAERVRTSVLANRVTPLVVQDAMDAYHEDGWEGAAKSWLPSTLGEGAQTYDPKKH